MLAAKSDGLYLDVSNTSIDLGRLHYALAVSQGKKIS
jgi:hypothetical protein